MNVSSVDIDFFTDKAEIVEFHNKSYSGKGKGMAHKCKECGFRAKYDNAPDSFLGRIWRWHTNWCPGWKKHISSLPDGERIKLAEKYDMKKWS